MHDTDLFIASGNDLPSVDSIWAGLMNHGLFRIGCLDYTIGQRMLEYLGNQLGQPLLDDVTNPNHALPYIHEVRPMSAIVVDKNGFTPESLTNKDLPCHTEDYFNEKPSGIVLFYCVQPAKDGGETYLVHVDKIINSLTGPEIKYLCSPIFPRPHGTSPILYYSPSECLYRIQYSRIIINKVLSREPGRINSTMILILDKLDDLLVKNRTQEKLKKNACIILDNTRVLHGRAGFDRDCNRLMHRIKFNPVTL